MLSPRRKKTEKSLLVGLGLMAIFLLIPNIAPAFETISSGDQELTVYGWLRNNTGLFLDDQPYQQNDDKLATERTWARTYVDYKASNQFRVWLATQFAYEPEYGVEDGSVSLPNGREYSEYNDINDVLREGYVEWMPNKKTDIKIGRQIAIWGESLTESVGDVVQPTDQRFTMAFSNLEDTRIPQWMIRSTHDIPALSSSFEWIANPNLTGKEYSVNRNPAYAKYDYATHSWTPGQRFGMYPEDRSGVPSPVVSGEMATGFKEEYPDSLDKMRYGFRTATNAGGATFGVSYFHTQIYDPLVKKKDVVGYIPVNPFFSLPVRDYSLVHPNMDIIGIYMNKQLPWPGVFRTEAIYSPNKPYNTFDTSDSDALVERNYYKYMVAYDLNGFLYPNWHKTAPIDISIEHVGEILPDNDDLRYIIYGTEQNSYSAHFNGRISTNWFYDRLYTDLTVSYWPWADSGLFMPSIKWKPGWHNSTFSAELKYINVYGQNDYEGLGFLRTKDMVVLTTQFNF